MAKRDLILPDPIPPLEDPHYGGGQYSPYIASGLRDVCGTRIQPDCPWYKRRELMTSDGCWLMTAVNPGLEMWINQVYGFDPRGYINQPSLADLPMTSVIPRFSARGEELPYPVPQGTYIVDYPSINSNPHQSPERSWAPKIKESLPEGSQLMLSFFGSRALTAGLWTLSDFWSTEFIDQFDGILMPDFSNFADNPWPMGLIGERQMQVFAQEGSESGANIIPTIAWPSEESLRRQVETWVSQYPAINTIHLDCYGAGVDRVGWIWRWLYGIEKYCQPHQQIRWLISGVTTGWAIRELNEIFPNNTYNLIMSVSPFVNSMVGSTDPGFRGQTFRRKIQTLEDFYSGAVVAERNERPETWPQFRDLVVSK